MYLFLFISVLSQVGNNPPGTTKVRGIYVDKFEIQNIHWLEYLHHASQELDSLATKKLLPDTSNFWYQLPSQRHKPIVYISYDQAIDYCAWRSKVVSKLTGKKILYRLPTEKEWREIADELLKSDEREVIKDLIKTKRQVKNKAGEYTLAPREKIRNKVYNLFDNVSEMVLENGIAKGANNLDLSEDVRKTINRKLQYSGPHAYVGFRCVAEVQ